MTFKQNILVEQVVAVLICTSGYYFTVVFGDKQKSQVFK